MINYYTRACNFYYGPHAKFLIQKKKALPLCGSKDIAFDSLEILSRKRGKKVNSRFIKLKEIDSLPRLQKKKIHKDLGNICKKRKNFLKRIDFNSPTIMGILNVTPDSFSDGGKFNNKTKALNHISKMIKSGAEIIDIGGESTRPGSITVSPKVEWKRLENILKNFKKKYNKICLSLDTRKSNLMVKGIENGVDLINDVSGFNFDKSSLNKIKKFNVTKVLHHMKGSPDTMQKKPTYKDVLLDVYDFFENNLSKFENNKIILDPGIGFGKTLKHNLTLISKISLFHSLGLPLMIGTSRKKFINQISEKYDSRERIGGTLGSILFLLLQGVQIFRVHNVKEVKQGILVFKRILKNDK